MKKDDYVAIEEMLRENERTVERERERVEAMMEQNRALGELLSKCEKLEQRLQEAEEECDDWKQECESLRMQLEELNKMATKVVEKTEHEDLVKVMRTYLNKSKRKQAKKRGYIKMVITEMAQSARLQLPEDMVETLENFDDEEERSAVENMVVNGGKLNIAGSATIEGDVLSDNAIKICK